MKLTPKYYECGKVTCDMTNTRKRFFKVMYGDEQVADIEFYRDDILGEKATILTNTILQGLDEETYNDVYELFSTISKDITPSGVLITLLEHEDHKHKTPYPTKFPRFRRKKEDGVLRERRNKEYVFPFPEQKSTVGKFFMILHTDSCVLVNKKTYLKLIESGIDVEFNNDENFPRILLGNEDIELLSSSLSYVVDNISVLETVRLNVIDDDLSNYIINLYFHIYGDDLKGGKVKLPELNAFENSGVKFIVHFINRDNGKHIGIAPNMVDLGKNAEKYNVTFNSFYSVCNDGIMFKEKNLRFY